MSTFENFRPDDIPRARTHTIVQRASRDLARATEDQVKRNITDELRGNLVIIDDEEDLARIVQALFEEAYEKAFPNGDH